jgi:phasin family protein
MLLCSKVFLHSGGKQQARSHFALERSDMNKTTAGKAIPKTVVKPKAAPSRGPRSVARAQKADPAPGKPGKAGAVRRVQVEKHASHGVGDARLNALGNEGLQVYARTGSIMVKGFEDLSREVALYAQATLEVNVAAAKAMTEAKSLDQMLDLQTKAARESFDIMVAEGTKLTELSFDLATKSMAPVQAQVDKAVATLLGSPAA